MQKKYCGTVVPMITPLNEDFSLDEGSLEKIMVNLYAHKAMPFILGTTGESASFSTTFKKNFIKKTAQIKRQNDLLYFGISSNCLEESIELAKFGFDNGADVAVATLPSYYMLTDVQMLRYFEHLVEAVAGPIIIYNIPATTHMSIPLTLIDTLSHHPNIVATKDSERSDERLDASLNLWRNRPDFSHFLGWAARSAYTLQHGGDGLVPSTGNVFPEIYEKMVEAIAQNDNEKSNFYQKQSDDWGAAYQANKTLGESLLALKILMQQHNLCKAIVAPPL